MFSFRLKILRKTTRNLREADSWACRLDSIRRPVQYEAGVLTATPRHSVGHLSYKTESENILGVRSLSPDRPYELGRMITAREPTDLTVFCRGKRGEAVGQQDGMGKGNRRCLRFGFGSISPQKLNKWITFTAWLPPTIVVAILILCCSPTL